MGLDDREIQALLIAVQRVKEAKEQRLKAFYEALCGIDTEED